MELDELAQLNAIEALEEAEIDGLYPRRVRRNENPFDLSDAAFVKLYRLSKEATSDLIDLITPHVAGPSRISALTIDRKVTTTLRFFASGSYQLDVGTNMNHAISQASVSRCIEEVATALNVPEIFNTHIKLPGNIDALREVRTQFYEQHNFPGVIGCVDCTHIAIYPPKINDPVHPEHIYVNRKGYHSINTQLICDANLKILNVNARYPGSTHDSYIWNNSQALEYMQQIHERHRNSFYLLGDSGYGLRPWLLTPIADALANSPEERYNIRHRSTRSLIERCNGVLKLRFRCLLKHRVLHYAPQKASRIVNACCVLHNMCINRNIPEVQFGDDPEDNFENLDFGLDGDYNAAPPPHVRVNRVNPDLQAGRRLQEFIVRAYFR